MLMISWIQDFIVRFVLHIMFIHDFGLIFGFQIFKIISTNNETGLTSISIFGLI